MRNFHDFFSEIYYSTKIPFNIKLNNNQEIKFLSDNLSKDDIVEESINLNKEFKIITSKSYKNCIPLLRYIIENRIDKIETDKEKILLDLIKNDIVDLEYIKANLSWILEKVGLVTIFSSSNNEDILSIIKQSYSNYDIIVWQYNNYVMMLCNLDDIKDHVEGIRDLLYSNLYIKCYISYCVIDTIKDIKNKIHENIRIINLVKKYNLSEGVYNEKNLVIENIVDGINKEIKKEIIKNFSHGFSKLDRYTIKTIDVFLKSGLNITDASKKLYIHRNTLIYRLDKIEKYTGYDIRNFNEAMIFKIAFLLCLEKKV